MRVFSILYRKELRSYLLNPLGWIVIAFVIIMHGISLSTAMKAFSDTPMANSLVYVSMHTPVFWFYFMVIFPLLTMKLFADEQRSGTLETLLTAPVKTWQVVLSKYCAVLTFYCLLWVPSYFQFQFYTWTTDLPPAWNNGSLIGTYAILFLMGTFFLAIGTRVESGKDWIGSRAHSRSMSINDCPHRGNRQRIANFRFFKSMHQSHAGWNACLSLEQF
jgi:ABC-2 type transport system permease protein